MAKFIRELKKNGVYFESKANWLSKEALEDACSISLSSLKPELLNSLEPGVTRVQQAFTKIPEVQKIIEDLLDCVLLKKYFQKKPILNFLVFRSPNEGSGYQKPHRDGITPSNGDRANELVAFMPLDRVNLFNGGTIFFPKSHMDKELLSHRPGITMDAEPGDVVWMDPSLYHAGQININGKIRRMLIASVSSKLLHPERSDNDHN